MKQLLVPIILITLVFAIGLGYYVINQKTPGGNPLKYGESISPTTTSSAPTEAAITPTEPVVEVNIDDLDATINSINMTDLNDTMSDLQIN